MTGELADANVRRTAVRSRHLGDVAPRCRHARTYREARDHDADHEHGQIRCDHHDEHARGIHEHVVGVDELSSQLVGEESADQRTNGGTESVRADRAQDSGPGTAEVECDRPRSKCHGRGNDAPRIEEIRKGNCDRPLSFL